MTEYVWLVAILELLTVFAIGIHARTAAQIILTVRNFFRFFSGVVCVLYREFVEKCFSIDAR
jgi:hypothetical protein